MSHTFLIAEAAATHDGSLDKAYRLIDLAAEIGADACKFQWLSDPRRLVWRRNAQEYLEAYKTIAFPRDWLDTLSVYCKRAGIEFMCTVYLPGDVEIIAPYVKRFKVASFEAQAQDFAYVHAAYVGHILSPPTKDILISTGMTHNMGDLIRIWDIQRNHSSLIDHVKFLQCTSAYPCPIDTLNIGVSRHGDWLNPKGFKGFSDHSKHPWAGALAAAAGLEIIEFHYRLHDTLHTNADYEVARSPDEAREYVANIRTAEIMLGDGVKRVQKSEEPMLRYRVKA